MRIASILILLALSACAGNGYRNGQSFSNYMATDPQMQRGLSMLRGDNPYAPQPAKQQFNCMTTYSGKVAMTNCQ